MENSKEMIIYLCTRATTLEPQRLRKYDNFLHHQHQHHHGDTHTKPEHFFFISSLFSFSPFAKK